MMQLMFIKWRKKCLVLVTVCLPVNVTVMAACSTEPSTDPAQRLVYDAGALRLYEPVNRADAPELTARVNWRTSPETLYRTVWDYAAFRQNIPGVRKSDILRAEHGRKWVYQQLKFPRPFQDRHYVLESSNLDSHPDSHIYRISWRLSQRFALPDNHLVQPTRFSGCWDIRPGKQGGLDALYHIALDPGGHIPRWIARRGMRQYVKELMLQLRKQVLFKYQQSSPSPGKTD